MEPIRVQLAENSYTFTEQFPADEAFGPNIRAGTQQPVCRARADGGSSLDRRGSHTLPRLECGSRVGTVADTQPTQRHWRETRTRFMSL